MALDPNRRATLIGALSVGAAAITAREKTTMTTESGTAGFLNRLMAPGPHPSLGKHADTYGRVIGSWAGTYEDRQNGSVRTGRMEVHFAWVMQGRAVQDLWIAPVAETSSDASSAGRSTYGTTVRVFDPHAEAWRVTWLNPPRNTRNDLVGRRVGDDIVQTGYFDDAPIKWVFTRITRDTFTWQGFALEPDGVSWRLDTEFQLRRTA
jgi:hypothetical protein